MHSFNIVTPAYNCAQFIDETIVSVLTQAGNFSIHYHIQDGGSTDGTLEKLQAWEERLKAPSPWVFCSHVEFSWESAPDSGMYDAINKGFDRLAVPAEGIMAWVNADDPYFPHAFSTVAAAFADLPDIEWFGGTIEVLHKNGVVERLDYNQPYPMEMIKAYCCDDAHWRVLQQNGMFWKGALWKKAGPLNADLRYAGDFDLWPRFAEHAALWHSPTPVGLFRLRDGQLSQGSSYGDECNTIRPFAERQKAARKFLPNPQKVPRVPALYISRLEGKFSLEMKRTLPLGYKKPQPWLKKLQNYLPFKLIISQCCACWHRICGKQNTP